MRRKRRWARWTLAVGLVPLGLASVYSGLYNVGATRSDWMPVAWVLRTTMERSVQRHAAGLQVPPLDDPALLRTGFQHYREMCVQCHGAPGIPIGETGQGLNPRPPHLVKRAGDWTPAELFWITKYGIRMTGMPAWGVTHSDDKVWAIVAFVRGLPTLTPEQYQALDRQIPPLSDDD